MRKESAGVTEALLKSAEQEFLAHGFHDASLRRISAEAASAPIPSIPGSVTKQDCLKRLSSRRQMA